jgi:hypothetical protein
MRAPAAQEGATHAASLMGQLAGPGGLLDAGAGVVSTSGIKAELLDASRPGWTINFIIFGSVYVVATVLWMFFDSTKPVVPEEK